MDTQITPPENTAPESGAEETIIQEGSAASPAAITPPESETSNEVAEDVLISAPAEIIEKPVAPSPAKAAESAPSVAPEQSVKNESPTIEIAPEITTEITPTPSPVLPEEKTATEPIMVATQVEQPIAPAETINELAPPPIPSAPEITINKESPPPPIRNDNEKIPLDYCSEHGFLIKLKTLNATSINARRKRREENLNKILSGFTPQDKITNNKVETLLKVSDRTAGRYLETLFKQGKIMKFGKTKSIFYQKYG